MFFLYRIVLAVGFLVLFPKFLFDLATNGKYAAGFKQRLGFLPPFRSEGRKVVWLHCVSVGETNAARPLALKLKEDHPEISLVVSTTTSTGQKVAREAFGSVADLVFYFPYDLRSAVRRALRHLSPSVVLLMETEIWFNFIRESNKSRAATVIVNGRLSDKSYRRFGYIPKFIKRVLTHIDMALMQTNADAKRLMSLGMRGSKVKVTGNLKFDHDLDPAENSLTEEWANRFGLGDDTPLIVAASTHSREEQWILDSIKTLAVDDRAPRLMIAPRHPERFQEVSEIVKRSGLSLVRRSAEPSLTDKTARVILLDSIGELRSVYPLATVVFVGGSLIPHGGQSIFEPAAFAKAMVVGPHTSNFRAAVQEFLSNDGIIQLEESPNDEIPARLAGEFSRLLADQDLRRSLEANALAVMNRNRGAVERTAEYLSPILRSRGIE